MTNVSAVEKMAELMQQMEENSPRVAALQYCLTQVAEKVEEAEKRNAELEARCAALSAENSGLKSAIDATIGWQQSTDPENVESVRMLVDVKTPVTDAFLAEVRAQGVDSAINTVIAMMNHQHPVTSKAIDIMRVHAYQIRKGVQS